MADGYEVWEIISSIYLYFKIQKFSLASLAYLELGNACVYVTIGLPQFCEYSIATFTQKRNKSRLILRSYC